MHEAQITSAELASRSGVSKASISQYRNGTYVPSNSSAEKMANVLGVDAQEVSDYMTSIWNNFSDGSKSLEYYADVMTALGATTASSTDEIAQGLEKFAAIGDTIGLSYEYAASALAIAAASAASVLFLALSNSALVTHLPLFLSNHGTSRS